jgi:hypothetical protein
VGRHQLRRLKSQSELFHYLSQIARARAGLFQPWHLDIEHRVSGSNSLRDVMAAGPVLRKPVIAEVYKFHRLILCLNPGPQFST